MELIEKVKVKGSDTKTVTSFVPAKGSKLLTTKHGLIKQVHLYQKQKTHKTY